MKIVAARKDERVGEVVIEGIHQRCGFRRRFRRQQASLTVREMQQLQGVVDVGGDGIKRHSVGHFVGYGEQFLADGAVAGRDERQALRADSPSLRAYCVKLTSLGSVTS